MRKTTAKFALHMETIRELSRMELSRAAGGGDTDTLADVVRQTRDKECVAADAAGGIAETPAKRASGPSSPC